MDLAQHSGFMNIIIEETTNQTGSQHTVSNQTLVFCEKWTPEYQGKNL